MSHLPKHKMDSLCLTINYVSPAQTQDGFSLSHY
jgi:hypothetical protein